MKMKLRIVFLIVILGAVCYGDVKKCHMNPETDPTCFQFWEQNQMIKMGQIPPECKDEVAKYDNAGPSGVSQSDKEASKRVPQTNCGVGGPYWCYKVTVETQNPSSKGWEKVVVKSCVLKNDAQKVNLKLGCGPPPKDNRPGSHPTRNGEVCLCDTDLCNAGEIKSLSLGAFLICGIAIVSSVTLF